VVVTDKSKIKTFDPEYHQPCVEQTPAVIVACANPHDTWERYDENDHCYILDTAAAIQNMLLAIHDQGLGGVWVVSFSKREVRKQLNIPPHWQIVSIIPFGYFEGNNEPRPRKELSEVAYLNNINCPIK
jgi:nitroreductase